MERQRQRLQGSIWTYMDIYGHIWTIQAFLDLDPFQIHFRSILDPFAKTCYSSTFEVETMFFRQLGYWCLLCWPAWPLQGPLGLRFDQIPFGAVSIMMSSTYHAYAYAFRIGWTTFLLTQCFLNLVYEEQVQQHEEKLSAAFCLDFE